MSSNLFRLPKRGHACLQDAPPQRLLSVLANDTAHFSGSDLYELCAEAASIPLYEESAQVPT